MRLSGKVAIITGAASGIGAGTAEVFAEEGAQLILVDRDATGLEAKGAQLGATTRVATFCGDVAQQATAKGAVGLALTTFGQLDIVFNNAGVMPNGDLMRLEERTWDETIAINLKSMYLMSKEAIAHMLQRGRGSIVNTSSVMATLTEPGYEVYTSSKAGIIGLTKALAVSYAEQGIRCNCICPGWVDTPMNQQLAESLGGMEQLIPLIKRQQPLPRMISTREIAYAVLFLASDEASAITGTALYIDGGASAAI